MICAWIETSSAATGSSRMSRSRLQRQRAGDADALLLAAGKFARVAPEHRRATGRPCSNSSAMRARAAHLVVEAVDAQRLGDDLPDRSAPD